MPLLNGAWAFLGFESGGGGRGGGGGGRGVLLQFVHALAPPIIICWISVTNRSKLLFVFCADY